MQRHRAILALGVAMLWGCGGAAPSTAPASSPTPTVAATADNPATPSITPSVAPSPTVDASVRDGEPWIAFQWIAGSGDGIFLVRPDGSGHHRLAPGRGASQIHPDWSPDGDQIAFVSITPADRSELWTVGAADEEARLLYSCDLPCNQVYYPDWAPGGDAIYFGMDADADAAGIPSTFRVGRYDLESGEVTVVLERRDGMTAEQPRISPDGRSVAYTRYRDPVNGDLGSAIFVADLDGGEEERLTDWDLFGAHPDWSTSDVIVFNSRDLGIFQSTREAANLYSMAPNGSGLQQLTRFGPSETRATQPRWAPDGTGIVFTQVDGSGFGSRRLAFIEADGSGQRFLTPSPLDGTHPQLRPLPD